VLAAIVATFLLVLASCRDFIASGCTAELRSVIQLDILDSTTRAPATAGAVVLLRGPFSDSLSVSDTLTAPTAHVWFEDRVTPGTYSLTIHKSGYRDWTRTDIRVEGNGCHATTFHHVVALLRR
jgi:hypothetical protein